MSWPYDIQFRHRLFWLSAKLLIGFVCALHFTRGPCWDFRMFGWFIAPCIDAHTGKTWKLSAMTAHLIHYFGLVLLRRQCKQSYHCRILLRLVVICRLFFLPLPAFDGRGRIRPASSKNNNNRVRWNKNARRDHWVSRSGKLSGDLDLIVFDVWYTYTFWLFSRNPCWKYPNHMLVYLRAYTWQWMWQSWFM